MATLEEIEARRAARKASADRKRAEQYAIDLEALDAAEVEHGDGRVAALRVDQYVEGLPTMAVIKTPSAEHYKRFCSMVRRAGADLEARGKAQDMLADVCWIYPADVDARRRMLEAFPGLLVSAAVRATQLAEFKEADEGKG